jgi:hypothetical protein
MYHEKLHKHKKYLQNINTLCFGISNHLKSQNLGFILNAQFNLNLLTLELIHT